MSASQFLATVGRLSRLSALSLFWQIPARPSLFFILFYYLQEGAKKAGIHSLETVHKKVEGNSPKATSSTNGTGKVGVVW
jgi:hypothetical protein